MQQCEGVIFMDLERADLFRAVNDRSMRTVKQQQNVVHIFSSFLEKILLCSVRNK